MSAELDRFRRALEDGVENEISGNAEELARSIVAAVWNAVDDERGRLAEENERLRNQLGLQPNAPEHGPLWSLLDWSFWGAGMGDVFRMPLADAMLAAVPAATIAQAEAVMAEFIERREIEKTGVTIYQEQRDELDRLRKQVADLEKDSATLAALEAAGVDNWEGYSDALAGVDE